MHFDKIAPVLKSQIVAERVVRKILDTNMKVGDKLESEREIAKAMNVGRNTLREAIAILQIAGILEVKRGSGIYISSVPKDDELRSLMDGITSTEYTDSQTAIDARIAMEPGAAILAARVANEEDWERLDSCIARMKEAVAQGEIDTYRKFDNELHKTIALITRNKLIISLLIPVIETARQPLWNAIKENVYNVEVLVRSLSEHEQIVASMKTRDEYYIFKSITQHLSESKSRLGFEAET